MDGVDLLDGDPPPRDLPIEYLAEGVRAPQVTLVRGPLKLIRSLGEPDLVYDLEADPRERAAADAGSLGDAVAARWDLERLERDVRASQARRRIVAQALATGRATRWDHPEGRRRYIDTGDDFWSTLERSRRA